MNFRTPTDCKYLSVQSNFHFLALFCSKAAVHCKTFIKLTIPDKRNKVKLLFSEWVIYLKYLDAVKMRAKAVWNIWTRIKWEAKLANLNWTPLMEHCRRDPRILDWELLQVLSFWVFLDFGKEFPSFLKISCQNQRKHRRSNLQNILQSFVILGSLLQWRWQWASIGQFVFLFYFEICWIALP